jgi:hypothetical protein
MRETGVQPTSLEGRWYRKVNYALAECVPNDVKAEVSASIRHPILDEEMMYDYVFKSAEGDEDA